MTYFFLGTSAQIGEIALHEKGQRVELPPAVAREAILGGCDLISETELQQAGIAAAEIESKLAEALAISQENRAQMEQEA
jgi:hypothetical protein